MVSPLWIAANDGDLKRVLELLNDQSLSSSLDIDLKDGAGATALFQAVKNGHVDVVRALLDAGADPSVTSDDLSLDQLTSDATILDLLNSAREKRVHHEQLHQQPPANYYPQDSYSQEYNNDPSKAYYSHPHGSYMYYPSIHPSAAPMPDHPTAPYYPPQQQPPTAPNVQPQPDSNNGSNLPPPEIARLIPCRYFPACRYGPSCIFAHPQGPYYQNSLPPPAPYQAPYDPMAQPPYPGYYNIPAPYPPNGVPAPVNAMSPPPNTHSSPSLGQNHARTNSELVSPVQAPFNPPPPPVPYGIPMTVPYVQHGQAPLPPIPVGMTPLPPPNQLLVSAPQPNGVMYQPTSPIAQTHNPPLVHRRESSAAAHHPSMMSPVVNMGENGVVSQTPQQFDGYALNHRSAHRDNSQQPRRGSMRRTSAAGARKPPCLFFPSGRCRNGDTCRFPHILPDANDHQVPHHPQKFGARPRPMNENAAAEALEAKLNGLSLKDTEGSLPIGNGRHVEGNGNARPNGFKQAPHVNGNGNKFEKRSAPRPQRVPNAEDFPVLAGTTTPTKSSPAGHAFSGPTAAQVLQAPPPFRKDSNKTPSQGSKSDASDSGRSEQDEKSVESKELNGNHLVNGNGNGSHIHDSAGNHNSGIAKPVTFASIASVAPVTPDANNQIPVTA